jgi:hypothetical protein
MAEERSGIPLADVFRDANGSDLPSPRLRRGRQVRSELEMPLANLIPDTAHAMVEALGLEQTDVLVEDLATRWERGTLAMQPADNQFTRPGRRGDRGGLQSKSEVKHRTSNLRHQKLTTSSEPAPRAT